MKHRNTQPIRISILGATGSTFAERDVISNKRVLWMHKELSLRIMLKHIRSDV